MGSGAKPMTKGGLAEALAAQTELKKSECMKVLTSLGEVGAQQVKKVGKLVLPGPLHVEDAREAGYEGGQARGFREGDDGEGEAGQDHREGLPRGRPEEEHLRWRRRARREGAGLVGAPRVRCPQALGSGPALRQDVPL